MPGEPAPTSTASTVRLSATQGKLVAAEVGERAGCQEASTLNEPYRIEGKKTMGHEIAEQLGWRMPA